MTQPINSLESLNINGVEQWVQLQSTDVELPVLLVLHGGPGYAIMPLFHRYNRVLERHFLVVNWDQRGAGRSYSPRIPTDSMVLSSFMGGPQRPHGVPEGPVPQSEALPPGSLLGVAAGAPGGEALPPGLPCILRRRPGREPDPE